MEGDGGGGGGGVESGAVLGQVSTLASGVLRDPHELLDKVADMPVVVPQPDKVVFVPVVQIVQVPQKLVVEVVEIPQLQLIEKIAAIPGVGGVVALKTVEVPQLQFVDEVVVFPVVAQRLIPMVLTVQSTIADPQLQLIDKVADVLRVHVVQGSTGAGRENLTRFPSSWCRSWRRQSRFHRCHVTRKTSR